MSTVDLADDDRPQANTRWIGPRCEPALRTFAFYIEDDRYSVPTLNIAMMASETRAREWAEGAMRENLHYLGVEVCENGERLFVLGALTDRTRA